jgi:hypothetical protein
MNDCDAVARRRAGWIAVFNRGDHGVETLSASDLDAQQTRRFI